jgi:hypothetical protein
MPERSGTIQTKIAAFLALPPADRKTSELVAIYWPSGTVLYASAAYDELPWWSNLAAAIETQFGEAIPLTVTLVPDRTPFSDLPRQASISDDSINLTFIDEDDEFSGLLMQHGEGIRVEVWEFWPAVDLLLSMWRGLLHQPKDMDRFEVKVSVTAGFRAPNMLVPKRPFATSCPFIFGAYFSTQEAITANRGCPYNAHLTEVERGGAPLIGVPGFTDCPRRVKADCFARLTEPDSATQTGDFWPGFETRADPIPNNQTKGPNLLAKAIGNESALSDPIRVIFGERYVKSLYLLAFRNELDTNHPEDGFGAALFAGSEGPNLAIWEFRIKDQIVGSEHFQLRLGELGQSPTDWSPDVNSYSGTAVGYGRIQGDFTNATASDYSGSWRMLGLKDVRVYSDPNTHIERYTTNRAWCLLHVLAHLRWGYGQDYPRFGVQSFIDAAAWCDEFITLTDANGNTFSGVRSTFNAEVTARAIQQQVKDICTAGRLGIPFEFEGKDVVVPLKAEDVDDPDIPSFTDEGPNRNIVYDGAKSSLSWSVISDETLTNQWTVNFDDAANSGVDTQFIFGDQAQQLRAGRSWGDRSKRVVNKSQAGYGINSAQEAARFGNSLLYLGPLDSGGILNPFSGKFTTWYSEAFNVQNYKLIKVVNAKLQSRMTAYFAARGLEPYPDADYTVFRVMKYTRKGDLRVEIEAQQYATLDIIPSEPSEMVCGYVTWASLLNASSLVGGGSQSTAALTVDPDWTAEPAGLTAEILSTTGDRFKFKVRSGNQRQMSVTLYSGATATNNYPDMWYGFGFDFGNNPKWWITDLGTEGGTVYDDATDYDVEDLWEIRRNASNRAEFYRNDVLLFTSPTDIPANSKLNVWLSEADAGIREVEFCSGSVIEAFGPPRDFTALVNPTRGVVHFHWSPPATHPELVTGYTLYESDGITVVMTTDLVYDYEITLAPGTYTYRLRATDGVTQSAFVSVTFTVDAPPVDLGLIDRETGNTISDRATGQILESRN